MKFRFEFTNKHIVYAICETVEAAERFGREWAKAIDEQCLELKRADLDDDDRN